MKQLIMTWRMLKRVALKVMTKKLEIKLKVNVQDAFNLIKFNLT